MIAVYPFRALVARVGTPTVDGRELAAPAAGTDPATLAVALPLPLYGLDAPMAAPVGVDACAKGSAWITFDIDLWTGAVASAPVAAGWRINRAHVDRAPAWDLPPVVFP